MVFRLLNMYKRCLQVYPIRTAAVSTGSLMSLGDAIAQTVVEGKDLSQFEPRRSLRFIIFGTFMAYVGMQHAVPDLLTKGVLMTFGDVLAQFVVEKRSSAEYDPKRTLRFAVFGTFFGGPLFSVWYGRLAKTFGGTKYASVKMVACDQLLFAPPFIAYFLGGMEVLKGEGLKDIQYKLQDDYLTVMKTNYKIWPLVQAVNFTFVPVHFRVVLVNCVAVGWNTYLAWISEKSTSHTDSPQDDTDENKNTEESESSS